MNQGTGTQKIVKGTKDRVVDPSGFNVSAQIVTWGPALGLIAFCYFVFVFAGFTMDDSYIIFRYATNLWEGHGLVFNVGEASRAEGITSPAYAVFLAIAPALDWNIVLFAKALGVLFTLVACFVLVVFVRQASRTPAEEPRDVSAALAAIAAVFYLSDPFVAANSLSGMETGFASASFMAYIFALWRVLTCEDSSASKSTVLLGFAAFVVPLIRPELTLGVVSGLAVAILVGAQVRARLFQGGAVFLLLGAGYFAWRFTYYEQLLPLPFHVKHGSGSLAGIGEVGEFLKHVVWLTPLTLLALARFSRRDHHARRPEDQIVLVVSAIVTIQLLYLVTLHHVMGFGFRYFQPVLPPMIAVAAIGAGVAWRHLPRNKAFGSSAAFVLTGLLIVPHTASNLAAYDSAKRLYVDWYMRTDVNYLRINNAFMSASRDKEFSIAMNDCGLIPFSTRWPTIDLAGLNNIEIALNRTSSAAVTELRLKTPGLVVLIARRRNDLTSVVGAERLTAEQVEQLGYAFLGSMEVDTNYHYLLFGLPTPAIREFASRLVASGVLETLHPGVGPS